MDDNPVSRLGLRAMLNLLGANYRQREKSLETYKGMLGKKITKLYLSESDRIPHNALHLEFSDDSKVKIYDDGQDCCEYRYMTTDDDLDSFVGSELVDIEVRDAQVQKSEWGDAHEIQFLLVNTTKGTFTMETHNEHNGYYGGFDVVVVPE